MWEFELRVVYLNLWVRSRAKHRSSIPNTHDYLWEILKKAYAGADKAKVMRLQMHKHKLKLNQMEENEAINNFTIESLSW